MRFTVLITAAPHTSESAATALRFCQTLIAEGHEITRLFFFGDGTFNASALAVTGQDEHNLPAAWQQFIGKNQLDAVVCVSSALKRGLVDKAEAKRHGLDAVSLSGQFEIAGLGQLVDAVSNSDRCINFA